MRQFAWQILSHADMLRHQLEGSQAALPILSQSAGEKSTSWYTTYFNFV